MIVKVFLLNEPGDDSGGLSRNCEASVNRPCTRSMGGRRHVEFASEVCFSPQPDHFFSSLTLNTRTRGFWQSKHGLIRSQE